MMQVLATSYFVVATFLAFSLRCWPGYQETRLNILIIQARLFVMFSCALAFSMVTIKTVYGDDVDNLVLHVHSIAWIAGLIIALIYILRYNSLNPICPPRDKQREKELQEPDSHTPGMRVLQRLGIYLPDGKQRGPHITANDSPSDSSDSSDTDEETQTDGALLRQSVGLARAGANRGLSRTETYHGEHIEEVATKTRGRRKWQILLEDSEATSDDLLEAAHDSHQRAANLTRTVKKRLLAGKTRKNQRIKQDKADQIEQLALQLDAAANAKLRIEAMEQAEEAKELQEAALGDARALGEDMKKSGLWEQQLLTKCLPEHVKQFAKLHNNYLLVGTQSDIGEVVQVVPRDSVAQLAVDIGAHPEVVFTSSKSGEGIEVQLLAC